MNKRRYGLIIFVIAGIISMISFSQASDEYQTAPNFELKNLEGETITLADFENKVLVLNFWATWCPPCRAEIPDFIEVYDLYNKKGLEILGVSVDKGSEAVSKFAASNKINYLLAMVTPEIIEAYEPGQYIPTTIIVDRKGKIRKKHVGVLTKADLEKIVKELLGS